MDTLALILSIIGCVNWGLVGIFQFDLVAWLFGGSGSLLSRIIYTIVGLAGLWCVTLLFRDTELYVFLDRQEQEAAKEAPLPGSVVAIFKDITRFRRQAQKAQERQQHLMEALVRAVEYVDPNLVGHTRKMRHVAELLARHMELDDTAVLTLRMASQLSQIGKIFVPHHLLRKSGKLTPEEQQAVLQSSEYAFRVLYGINFGLPVPEALHDMNEKFDGSGPRALKGDQINPHARLLAVVNAFCSMVSDRAYRQGMPIEQALDILSSSPAFDPAMVLALREIPADDLRSALAGEDAPSRA